MGSWEKKLKHSILNFNKKKTFETHCMRGGGGGGGYTYIMHLSTHKSIITYLHYTSCEKITKC